METFWAEWSETHLSSHSAFFSFWGNMGGTLSTQILRIELFVNKFVSIRVHSWLKKIFIRGFKNKSVA
jgi:hypothetical protein